MNRVSTIMYGVALLSQKAANSARLELYLLNFDRCIKLIWNLVDLVIGE
jgi:hypothetical protein